MPAMSAYTITPEDVRDIAATSGFDHAELCIEQMESQDGVEAARACREELDRLAVADAAADLAAIWEDADHEATK